MGIQGLGGYIDNNDLSVYYNKARDGKKNFKFLYLDFQSIIYTVFNYQENLINMMLSNLHNYDLDAKPENIENNNLILGVLNKIRLLIKDTELGRKLFIFNKKVRGIDTTVNLLETEFKFIPGRSTKHTLRQLVIDIGLGIENYMANKMNNVSDCIIELIKNLISNFDDLKECYIIFDGKPFVGKMVEQVKRRVPDSIINDIIVNIEQSLTKNGHINLPENILFERYLISRDSDFVRSLIKKFKDLKLKNKLTEELKIEVISEEDGEGEHIINKKIIEKGMKEEGNFLYYSPDGDVVFLCIILNIILRMNERKNFVHLIKFELNDYTYYKFENEKYLGPGYGKLALKNVFWEPAYKIWVKINLINQILDQTAIKLQYIDISNFENKLLENIEGTIGKITPVSKNIMLVQYILMFSIFGNDFLPKLLSVSIGEIPKIVQLYNNYLKKKADAEGKNLTDFLTKDSGDFSVFKFLANFDGNEIKLNQNILLDFLKLLCNHESGNCKGNENEDIRKKLRNEQRKKDMKEIFDSFVTKCALLNYRPYNIPFEFLKHLLNNNFYFNVNNFIINDENEESIKHLLSDIGMIKKIYKSPTLSEAEQKVIEDFQSAYYKDVLYDSAHNYYFKGADYAQNLDNIIKYDGTKKAEDPKALKQYIQGFQYIADLYFTCDVKNKCWHYQFEHPPRINDMIKYMSDNSAVNLLDYSGFYGASQEALFNDISHKLTRKINTQYIRSQSNAKYYLINDIFDCFNIRYLNKCQLHADTNLVFLNESGDIINIMDEHYDVTLDKPKKILELVTIAKKDGGSNNYYKKYLKYKMKYLKLKNLI